MTFRLSSMQKAFLTSQEKKILQAIENEDEKADALALSLPAIKMFLTLDAIGEHEEQEQFKRKALSGELGIVPLTK